MKFISANNEMCEKVKCKIAKEKVQIKQTQCEGKFVQNQEIIWWQTLIKEHTKQIVMKRKLKQLL